ncbi:MAG: virulence RhuM family protein [Bacteroidales bacterium]|nr:virulence RhuM family protein [Bacteroidales bacterium]
MNSIEPQNNESVVIYRTEDDTLQLNVQVANETVWLTQQQMSELFQKDRTVITRHINNIFREGELEEKSNVQNLHFPFSDKPTKVYNLDVIISVGYRVKSKRGTQFRRWATSILKEYLLKGYAINQRLIAMEERMDRRFAQYDSILQEHQEKIDFFVNTNLPPVEKVFFEGDFFEARVLLEKLVKTAQQRVIVIDAYIDAATFELLDVRGKSVSADIYSGKDLSSLRDMYNTSKKKNPINTHIWSKASHDRWLIIDNSLYHCGHSLKDMGRKLSAITLMGISPEEILNSVK